MTSVRVDTGIHRAFVRAVLGTGGSVCEELERYELAYLSGLMSLENRGVIHRSTIEALNVYPTYTRVVKRVRRKQIVFEEEEEEKILVGGRWETC